MRALYQLALLSIVLAGGRNHAAETEWRGTNGFRYTFFYDDQSGAVRGYMVAGDAVTNWFHNPAFGWADNTLRSNNGPRFHLESHHAKEGWAVGTFTNGQGYRVTIKFYEYGKAAR